ncbi:hypothetical protein [Rothia aeria]|uniref:hypothetical protein n=2 Tax=Rothia aeria TaxID=172042 RepID=UPI0028D52D7C|nr:hypothetical protein [Rothia aeria]
MENSYKIINNRANILLEKSLVASLGVVGIYCSVYVSLFIIFFLIFGDSINVKYIFSYVPKRMPVQPAILTALGALILSLFINVRTEIKDIDNISQNSQIKALAYKKFAKILVYIIGAVLFSHVVNNIYLYLSESKKIEELDPPLYVFILFIFFMLIMVHLPGEYQISLEGQYEDSLEKLARYEKYYMTKNNLKISEYLSKVYSNDTADNKCKFDKYLSKYSYNRAYLNYFAGCSGYLSVKKYILICLVCMSIFYLCIVTPMLLIYLDVFISDLELLFGFLGRTCLGLLLLGFFIFFIIPGPQIIENLRERSRINLIIYCIVFIIMSFSITTSYGRIISMALHERRASGDKYTLFEFLIPIMYIAFSCIVPTLWGIFLLMSIKKIGQRVLNIPNLSVIDILHFAKLWNMWLIAKSIYEQRFIYRNSMNKNQEGKSSKIDLEINYLEFKKRYNVISDKVYRSTKSKNDNNQDFVFPDLNF